MKLGVDHSSTSRVRLWFLFFLQRDIRCARRSIWSNSLDSFRCTVFELVVVIQRLPVMSLCRCCDSSMDPFRADHVVRGPLASGMAWNPFVTPEGL